MLTEKLQQKTISKAVKKATIDLKSIDYVVVMDGFFNSIAPVRPVDEELRTFSNTYAGQLIGVYHRMDAIKKDTNFRAFANAYGMVAGRQNRGFWLIQPYDKDSDAKLDLTELTIGDAFEFGKLLLEMRTIRLNWTKTVYNHKKGPTRY